MGKYFFDKNPDPLDRVDGVKKVTGSAEYSAEYKTEGMTYAILVGSTIAKGTINSLDTKAAERADGVLAVITYLNMPKVPAYQSTPEGDTGTNGLKIFNSNKIYFDGQPIALVVADTIERAVYAASLVKATYFKEEPSTDIYTSLSKAAAPKNKRNADYVRGEADAYKNAPVAIEEEYTLPNEIHNPMELGSIIAIWDNDKLTVYDKTQGVKSTQNTFAKMFKIPAENVRVISPFVGGAFGMALRTWPYEVAAVVAAKKINRPVHLMLTRPQMFTQVGYRPNTIQNVAIGATPDGKLVGITHKATSITSTYEEFVEGTVNATKFLYVCPNVNTNYKIVSLDVGTPTWMRGPGEATGLFALECAIDELSYKLNIDSLDLRKKNYAETDPERNLPWSSKYLNECYEEGAKKIGWYNRNRQPRSMTEDGMLVGYGMSTGTFGASRGAATARAILHNDGKLLIQSAASDIGPGTGTAMVTIASQVLSMPATAITFELGDSMLPPAPTQGGSGTLSAVGSAVFDVCTAVKDKLLELASLQNASYKNITKEQIVFTDGSLSLANGDSKISYTDILKQNNQAAIDITRDSKGGNERQQYAMYSFSVHFVKVHVHPLTGVVKVNKVVSVADAGTIVSEKTAESQMIGGVTGGIGMALTEEGVMDHRYGRYVNNNLADYHVPVNADVPEIDIIFINKKDPYINPMGAKGMGEIALIGFAAAVANAVFHATGKRVRDLPITPDKLI